MLRRSPCEGKDLYVVNSECLKGKHCGAVSLEMPCSELLSFPSFILCLPDSCTLAVRESGGGRLQKSLFLGSRVSKV